MVLRVATQTGCKVSIEGMLINRRSNYPRNPQTISAAEHTCVLMHLRAAKIDMKISTW